MRGDDVDVTGDGALEVVAEAPGIQPAVLGDGVDDPPLTAHDRHEQVSGRAPSCRRSPARWDELLGDLCKTVTGVESVPTPLRLRWIRHDDGSDQLLGLHLQRSHHDLADPQGATAVDRAQDSSGVFQLPSFT
jgi:hypothetical protein